MQIDFYVLPDDDETKRLHYVCRLVAKAWRAGFCVYIQCQDEAQSVLLDELLWSFSSARFIPHQRVCVGLDAPVLLAFGDDDAGGDSDFLLNLSEQVPAFFQRFTRIAEVGNQEPNTLHALRAKYKFYCQNGQQPRHLNV